MDASQLAACWRGSADSDRPWKFLVSTTSCVKNLSGLLGAADYSYGFVLKALAPVLEEIGSWELVEQPESRLVYQAARALESGHRPVQLAVCPLHALYLTPAVPTIAFPFWEFPRIPDRDFGFDTRQNWARIAESVNLILTASRLTAESFRRAGVITPVELVPVPLDPADFEVTDWSREREICLTCRHVSWGGPLAPEDTGTSEPPPSLPEQPVQGWDRVERAIRIRYKRHVKPWLSERAADRISLAKQRFMRRAKAVGRPPESELRLSGLVYTSIFNLGDFRKNPRDMLSGFLLAFRDRPDVTLVLKLATNPITEWQELSTMRQMYEELGIEHACRVVVIADYLSEDSMRAVLQATTYYVNTSRAEGACLPLQRALAAGRPGIAPAHTAMADYMDDNVGFLIGSHPEPTHWPHDPQRRCETTWHRLIWTDLRDQYLRSSQIADHAPEAYARLAMAARQRMAATMTREVSVVALRRALRHVRNARHGAVSWSA